MLARGAYTIIKTLPEAGGHLAAVIASGASGGMRRLCGSQPYTLFNLRVTHNAPHEAKL